MNFELTQDQKVLRDSVRDFVEKEIRPIAAKIDEEHRIPQELTDKMAEMGFFGSYIPEKYGGAGLDALSYALLIEEISKACASNGVYVSAHTSLCCDPLLNFGTEEQKLKWLPDLTSGRKIGCILLTESDAGSDVSSIATSYRREGDHFVVNGSKLFITNGGCLGTGILFATKDKALRHKGLSAFIVDMSSPGLTFLKEENKMGIRGTSTAAFAFDNLRVPSENLLAEEGMGFKIAMETLNGGRIGIAAQALGIAEGAFERTLEYSKQRQQFGKPLCAFQSVQFKLADMFARIEQARLLVYKAACMKDAHVGYSTESALCKLCASEAAAFVTTEAVQIHGGYGYIADYEVERMFRDAKITEIYEGTSEMQRIVISKALIS